MCSLKMLGIQASRVHVLWERADDKEDDEERARRPSNALQCTGWPWRLCTWPRRFNSGRGVVRRSAGTNLGSADYSKECLVCTLKAWKWTYAARMFKNVLVNVSDTFLAWAHFRTQWNDKQMKVDASGLKTPPNLVDRPWRDAAFRRNQWNVTFPSRFLVSAVSSRS